MDVAAARPGFAIAHVLLRSHCLAQSAAFFRLIGLRPVFEGEEVAIFELRGGTHLILLPSPKAEAGQAAFDLMVDDLVACHARFDALGLSPSAIESMPAIDHEAFSVLEPGGQRITVFSSHASGLPI